MSSLAIKRQISHLIDYQQFVFCQSPDLLFKQSFTICFFQCATVLLSAATSRKIKSDLAMTGELTIHGEVLPVGGITEKANAAYENGIKTIIVPKKNEKDVENLSEEIKKKIKFVFVDQIDQVFNEAFVGSSVVFEEILN